MPRKARIIIPGYIYHITQRGNNKQNVFFENNDYILYLKRTEEYAKKFGVKIYAYCLMKNHVHFIAEPKRKDSFAYMFRGINMRYAQYFQKRTDGSGHVWQGRYYSCLLQGTHLPAAIRYVELNPVRANMVTKASYYTWSSAKAHLGQEYKWITLSQINNLIDENNWEEFLEEKEESKFLENIRNATKKNLVLGMKNFIEKIEKRCKRKIQPNAMGRPKKLRKII